ncbi:hypothetical protein G6O67_004238 [Ophiocordyceps sinensis]|uniref:Uncharacterized protein n=1 Tax=Ophiocordyceps sinensis TaxID=72228 RepID=A0A8H4PPF5_9HYPO|nr:hypothetical protein G6O67_004238 [Ophiocordyceps sinensis]
MLETKKCSRQALDNHRNSRGRRPVAGTWAIPHLLALSTAAPERRRGLLWLGRRRGHLSAPCGNTTLYSLSTWS